MRWITLASRQLLSARKYIISYRIVKIAYVVCNMCSLKYEINII